ncbi:Cullin repeat-like-containing domain protein [Irpex lacteus]|nr:Cullin repeat-like-containing domain protein [Irpex lacteus]
MSRDKYPDENTPVINEVVKPLPNPSTGSANPSASLPALWGYLQPALDHIVRGPTSNESKAPAIEVSYHMGVHTAVYNYFTAQADSGLPHAHPPPSGKAVAGRGPQDAKPSGTDLYEQLDRYYAETTHEILLGAPHDDADLIHYLLPCFHRYSAGAQSVNRLLNYVNRHYVKRAVDEDKGWLRLADFYDAVAKSLQENDARDVIQKRLKEKRVEELKKWGWYEGAPAEVLARTEACAEAASPPDRIVPLSSMALRRFRTEVIVPLLSIPVNKKGGKKKKPPAKGDKTLPKGRLARAVKDLLEGEAYDPDERVKTAGELALMLRTVGIRPDQPLRKKLDKYATDI